MVRRVKNQILALCFFLPQTTPGLVSPAFAEKHSKKGTAYQLLRCVSSPQSEADCDPVRVTSAECVRRPRELHDPLITKKNRKERQQEAESEE